MDNCVSENNNGHESPAFHITQFRYATLQNSNITNNRAENDVGAFQIYNSE